jgi:opacity protein-like surface antigen
LKKIAIILLFISSLYGDAKIYTGASYGYLNETFSNENAKANAVDVSKIKIGYGDREGYAVEFSVDYSNTDSDYLSTEDSPRYAINVDLVKAFDFDIYINPFFKAGIGTGYLDSTQNGNLTFGSFKIGAGTFIPVTEYLDFELGYEYKYISYEKIQSATESELSDVNIVYAGFNVRF